MIIDIKHLYKDYHFGNITVPALKDVSFSVEEGEYLAIMGPSGSGKSTLMNIMGLLDRPTSGEYELAGENTLLLNEKQLAAMRNQKIGFVFQRFHLLPSDTALQNANPKETIRIADIDGASAAPPVIPNTPQNCFAKIQISIVAITPSISAAFMPSFITLFISL